MYVCSLTQLSYPFTCGGKPVLSSSLSCNERIGQGVRFNAEKRQIGNYYSTPIYLFKCKCPSCKHVFEIRTDPQVRRWLM